MENITFIDIDNKIEDLFSLSNLQKWGTEVLQSKHQNTQIKLKREFAIEFANNRLEMTNAAFFVLDKLTIFADIDYSIDIDFESFRRTISMQENTFNRSLTYLRDNRYIVYRDDVAKYFFTEKTHTVVNSIEAKNLSLDNSYYVPTLPIISWALFNTLTAIEQRFLYHILTRYIALSGSRIKDIAINDLLHNRKRSKQNKHYTEINNIEQMTLAFKKFDELGLFSVAFLQNGEELVWESSKSAKAFDLIQFDSEADYIVRPKRLYASGGLENVNNYYIVEHFLSQYNPRRNANTGALDFTNINKIFKDKKIELNRIIFLKKYLLNSLTIENRSSIANCFTLALAEFIKENYELLMSLADNEYALYNRFKDFYFLPKVKQIIFDTIPHVFINGDFVSPVCKTVFSKSNFIGLIKFYAKYVNTKDLLIFKKEIENLVADFSYDDADYTKKMNVLEDLLGDSLSQIKDNVEKTLLQRYNETIATNGINLTFEAFCNVTTFVAIETGKWNDDVLADLYMAANERIAETDLNKKLAQNAHSASKVVTELANQQTVIVNEEEQRILDLIESRSDLKSHADKLIEILNAKKEDSSFNFEVFEKTLEIVDVDIKGINYLTTSLMNNLKNDSVPEFRQAKANRKVGVLPEWFENRNKHKEKEEQSLEERMILAVRAAGFYKGYCKMTDEEIKAKIMESIKITEQQAFEAMEEASKSSESDEEVFNFN